MALESVKAYQALRIGLEAPPGVLLPAARGFRIVAATANDPYPVWAVLTGERGEVLSRVLVTDSSWYELHTGPWWIETESVGGNEFHVLVDLDGSSLIRPVLAPLVEVQAVPSHRATLSLQADANGISADVLIATRSDGLLPANFECMIRGLANLGVCPVTFTPRDLDNNQVGPAAVLQVPADGWARFLAGPTARVGDGVDTAVQTFAGGINYRITSPEVVGLRAVYRIW